MEKKNNKKLSAVLRSRWSYITIAAILGALLNISLLVGAYLPSKQALSGVQEEQVGLQDQVSFIRSYKPTQYISEQEAMPLLSKVPPTSEQESFTAELYQHLLQSGAIIESIEMAKETGASDLITDVMQMYNENIQPASNDAKVEDSEHSSESTPAAPVEPASAPKVIEDTAYTITLQGTSAQLQDFMNRLQQSERLYKLTSVELEQAGLDEDSAAGQLQEITEAEQLDSLNTSLQDAANSHLMSLKLNITMYHSAQLALMLEPQEQ